MTELLPEDRAILKHAALHAALTAQSKPPRRLIDRVLEPAVLVALITVTGTGIFGTWITGRLQERAKEREIALANFRQTNEARLKVAADAYDLVGTVVAAGDDLITTTEIAFATAQDDVTRGQVQELLQSYNEGDRRWRATQARTGLLLAYHHDAPPEAIGWPAVADAVRGYVDCARTWRLQHSGGAANASAACGSQRDAVANATETLTKNLLAAKDALLRKQARLQ